MSLGRVNGLNLLGQGGAATAARMAPDSASAGQSQSASAVPADSAQADSALVVQSNPAFALPANSASAVSAEAAAIAAEPKLGVAWGDFHQGFFSGVRALFAWPWISGKFFGSEYFRDCWVERRIPKRAVFAAALWHVVFLVSPVSLLTATLAHNSAFDHMQLTWSGPIEDFPLLEIPAAKAKPIARTASAKAMAPKGADAFHPRQRILTDPVHPNHARQTLINPAAPRLAPKLLPQMPNIVQLQAAAPVRPRIEISAQTLAKLHPRQKRRVATSTNAPPPDVPVLDAKPAELTLTASAAEPARPKLDLNTGAAPRLAEHTQQGDVSAPELAAAQAANGSPTALISLSAAPAPPKPEVQPPAGNLAARVSISSDGKKPGVPGGTASESVAPAASASAVSNGAGKSDVGISISGGNPQPKANTSGSGSGRSSLILPSSHGLSTRPDSKPADEPERTGPPNFSLLAPGAKPEQVFAAKHVYTMAVNMANINSASGSWILHFAELGSRSVAAYAGEAATPTPPGDLAMPVPVRKVDPKYPPDLIDQNVQGEVVLYGVIRADGSVDSIQVARSLDPTLDANAKSAFAQWKFTPAAKAGTPVDVEVIAHIPFKIRDDR